jgi:O-antigen ligase
MGSLFGALRSWLKQPVPALEAPPELNGVRAAWLGGVFVAIFGVTGLLAYAGPLGFAAVLAIGGVFGLGLVKQARLPSPMIWPWMALALWSLVSMAWAPLTKDLSLAALLVDFEKQTAVKLIFQALLYGAFIVAAASLPQALAKRALTGLAVGLVMAAALVLVEGSYGAAIYQRLKVIFDQPIRPDLAVKNVAQATYILALFCWPVALFLSGRFAKGVSQWMIGTLFIGLVAAAVQMSADAALAGLAVGLVAYSAVAIAGRLGVLLLVAATTVYWVATPLLVLMAVDHGLFLRAQAVLGASWDARLDIWSFATARIMEHPLLGWGLDASRTFGNSIPLHTHDGALQVWLELGAVGALLMATAWLFLLKAIYDLIEVDRPLAAVAAASACAYLMIGAVSFGVWQEWWLALGALAFAVIVALKRVRPAAQNLWLETTL